MKLESLHDLFVEQLRDLYDAEQQITKALPKMAENASSPDLRRAFNEHMDQTRQQIQRLDQVFDHLNIRDKRTECQAMKGIIKEGEEMMKYSDGDGSVTDAALIAAAQKVEHYEIASYGTVATYASQMNHREAADLLHQTLDEEKETDLMLTRIAEAHVNREAQY
jgi:ferritin-like metal-binding protein YciE